MSLFSGNIYKIFSLNINSSIDYFLRFKRKTQKIRKSSATKTKNETPPTGLFRVCRYIGNVRKLWKLSINRISTIATPTWTILSKLQQRKLSLFPLPSPMYDLIIKTKTQKIVGDCGNKYLMPQNNNFTFFNILHTRMISRKSWIFWDWKMRSCFRIYDNFRLVRLFAPYLS